MNRFGICLEAIHTPNLTSFFWLLKLNFVYSFISIIHIDVMSAMCCSLYVKIYTHNKICAEMLCSTTHVQFNSHSSSPISILLTLNISHLVTLIFVKVVKISSRKVKKKHRLCDFNADWFIDTDYQCIFHVLRSIEFL